MSNCWNCGTEITLKQEETKCDSCKKTINFKCHNCHNWFSLTDKKGSKIKECKYCGYFKCPSCNACGEICESNEYKEKVVDIINGEGNVFVKAEKIVDYFGDVKVGKDRRNCPKGVSISYAKYRIKTCIVRMMGYRTKDEEDIALFRERYENILDKNIGEILTINQARERGSYGQEYRDVFNYAICMGKLKLVKIKKIIDGEEKEIEVYQRVEESICPMLKIKNLVVKQCPNPKCNIKIYPEAETHCVRPECKYQKGNKKGQLRELKLKISNEDTCQLARGEFKKEENGKSKFI